MEYIDFTAEEFIKYVKCGHITDSRGAAELIYDNSPMPNYIICIDTRVVATSGRVLNYKYFIDNYDLDKMIVRYTLNDFGFLYFNAINIKKINISE